MTRLAAIGLGVLLALVAGAVLLMNSPAGSGEQPEAPPAFFDDLIGDWTVTVRMRDKEGDEWKAFSTPARIEALFDGLVLRERSPDTSKPWRELAFTRWNAEARSLSFEHVFNSSLSMLRMSGRYDPATRSIRYEGRWHRQRGDDVSKKPASGLLTIESRDRHLWQLDQYREDGTSFVDLEMTYERVESPSTE